MTLVTCNDDDWDQLGNLMLVSSMALPFTLTALRKGSNVTTKVRLLLAHGTNIGWIPFLLPPMTHMGTSGDEPRFIGYKSVALTAKIRLLLCEKTEQIKVQSSASSLKEKTQKQSE